MKPPIKAARTAAGQKTGNTVKHDDTVLIVFDYPFAAGDNPAHETFELSWVAQKGGGASSVPKTRATAEVVEMFPVVSLQHVLLSAGHFAIHFEGLTPGVYKLTRSDGRKEPEVIFSNVPHDELTGPATNPEAKKHEFWTWLDDFTNPADPDIQGFPTDVTTLPAPETRKAK